MSRGLGDVYKRQLCTLLTPQALALEDPDIRAKAAILVDADSGTVLYDKNIHEELPMASITKVMSALLVLEAVDRGQLRMDQGITATESAMKGMVEDGSTADIKVGETLTVEQLLNLFSRASGSDEADDKLLLS